jgi:8-oxo-dGTP diphosphatase
MGVDASVRSVHEMVMGIRTLDALEEHHKVDTLKWLESTNDVYRRSKPATPERHLVSYFVLADLDDHSTLLVDHINAGRWLPPGGHVEPGEHPADTVRREAREELGSDPIFDESSESPLFVTVNRTDGIDGGHIDVSLWFLLRGCRSMALSPDLAEFNETRWWTPTDVGAAIPRTFDRHYTRFLKKAFS